MKRKILTKKNRRALRQKRVRTRIFGTAQRPRLCVSRGLNSIFAQIINDEQGRTVVSAHSRNIKTEKGIAGERKGKIAIAYLVGQELAKKALEAKVKQVVFDRAGNQYHGRIKAVAEGTRDGGLEF